MILFIDTEWADTQAKELVSLALVSDCGKHEFYAERDPLPEKATQFVRWTVYPLLERGTRALTDDQFTASLHKFFEDVLEVARRGKVLVAFDHRNDIALLEHALDGFDSPNTPQRPPFNRFNLGLLGVEFDETVEERFARDAAAKAKRHNALTDAWVNRDAYITLRDREAWALSEFERLRKQDPEIIELSVNVLGNELRAARWWIKKSRALGSSPNEIYAEGRREAVVQELYAIKYSIAR